MLVIVSLLFIAYALLLHALYNGWVKISTPEPDIEKVDPQFISIIVPVRNEEKAIAYLLDDIIGQQYTENCFELLIVNDHSEDNTIRVIEEKLKASSFSNVTIVQSLKKGKKWAITEGVNLAKGSIILTTDADCRVELNWLASFNSYFNNSSCCLVFGPVRINQEGSIFSKMQVIEFASLIGSGAATLGYGMPTMCNGANLAFRKDVFNEVNGYEGNFHVASGDDEFLMRKIHQKYPNGIVFNNTKDSIVSTRAQGELTEFISQRLRWASKWKLNKDFKTRLLAAFIFLFHATVLSLPVLVLLGYVNIIVLLVLLSGKAFLEYRFINRVTTWLQIPWSWSAFILLQLVYSLYAVLIGLVATFSETEWKGRKI